VGDPVQVSQEYYALTTHSKPKEEQANGSIIPQQNTGMGEFIEADLDPSQNTSTGSEFKLGSDLRIRFVMQTNQDIEYCVFNISIYSNDGIWMIGQTSLEQGVVWPGATAGAQLAGTIELKNLCLAPGNYKVALGACSEDLSICYALSDLYLSFSIRSDHPTWGRVQHPCQWTITETKKVMLP
jgi:hypothetical protein